jgi:hypothetical protein
MASSLYLVGDGLGIDVGPAWEGLGLRGNASAPRDVRPPSVCRLLRRTRPDLMLGVVLPGSSWDRAFG